MIGAIGAGAVAGAIQAGGGGGPGTPGTLAVKIAPNPCVGYYDINTGGVVTQHAIASVTGEGVGPFRFLSGSTSPVSPTTA